jgi:hypothetical protein
MPTETDPATLLDDVADECDRLAGILILIEREDAENLELRLQALSFYRLAIAVENLGAEATEELMAATVDEAARRGMVPPSRGSSRLPKKHAGG